MNILIAGESSGIVREAFTAQNHNAYSCDLKPTEIPGQHYQEDYQTAIQRTQWDLIIAHPDCQYIACSGNRWYSNSTQRSDQVKHIVNLSILLTWYSKHWCIESSIGVLSSQWEKPTQIVQPWMFGSPFVKASCYWLHGLPKLQPTNILPDLPGNRQATVWKMAPSVTRATDRARTDPNIAKAMSQQWSSRGP